MCRLIADEIDAAAFPTTNTSTSWLHLKHWNTEKKSPNIGYKKKNRFLIWKRPFKESRTATAWLCLCSKQTTLTGVFFFSWLLYVIWSLHCNLLNKIIKTLIICMTYSIFCFIGLVIKPTNKEGNWFLVTIRCNTEAAERTSSLSTQATIFVCDLWRSRATISSDEWRLSASSALDHLTWTQFPNSGHKCRRLFNCHCGFLRCYGNHGKDP